MYHIASNIAVSRCGKRLLQKKFKNKKLEKIRLHFQLLRFSYYLNDDGISELVAKGERVKIHTVDDCDYRYWNNCFHTNCISHIVCEMLQKRIPYIQDEYYVYEAFFDQPFDTAVIDDCIPESKSEPHIYFAPKYIPFNKVSYKAWCNLFKYIVKINKRTKEYVAEELENLRVDSSVLGVILRGTDYVNTRPKGHTKQPTVDEVIKTVKEYLSKYDYNYIYLATEEKRIYDRFELEFPGKIITNKRHYYDEYMTENGLTYITEVEFGEENEAYIKGIEYLSSLILLSKCGGLVGGNCGGTKFSLFLNGMEYKHIKVFDRGLY